MQLSRFIDHTLLKPEAQISQIEQLCAEAKTHNFFSVCVNTCFVTTCRDLLMGSSVKVCCVVGFPLGAMDTASKAFEAQTAIANGADEIDMVINVGSLKDRRLDFLQSDIQAVVAAAQSHTVKVIIETALLTEEEKTLACQAALKAGAHFVKTCTGFSGGGATIEDVQLMKNIVGEKMHVKASGGIKTTQQAMNLIQAGASRLGTSSGVALTQGQTAQGGY